MRSIVPIPGARKLILCVYLGLSTFIAAHIVNAFVADALLVSDPLPPMQPSQEHTPRNSVSSQQLAQDMMTLGLFATPAESPQGVGSSTNAGQGPPLDAGKKLLLHGTAIAIGNAPIAIVQDLSNQQQKLLHLHDHVPNVGELVSIEKNRVLFQDRGQEEWLGLAMLKDLEQAQRMPPLPESLPGQSRTLSQPIRHAQHTSMVSLTSGLSSAGGSLTVQLIDRRELSKALADIPLLLLQAQLAVSMIDGRSNGILLELVRIGGLYNKMGLHSGDILKRLNGIELREPSVLLTALQLMQNEQRVKLDIVRNDTPRTLTYQIR